MRILSYHGDSTDYDTIDLDELINASIEFEFNIDVQDLSTEGFNFDEHSMGSETIL